MIIRQFVYLNHRSTCSLFVKAFLWALIKSDVMSLMEKYCRLRSDAMQNSSEFQCLV